MSTSGFGSGGPVHRVSRRARDQQLIPWVTKVVESQGGRATFMARGRTERRVLETIQQDLPDGSGGYVADLIWFTPGTPAGNRRHQDQETRLYVQRADLAGTRQTISGDPQAQLLADIDQQLEAEKTRIRREYPGWHQDSIPPADPGN